MTGVDKRVRDIFTHLAAKIRRERERQGLSMLSVAERAGVSQQMVSYVERGMRNPSLETLIRISHVLDLDLPGILAEALRKK